MAVRFITARGFRSIRELEAYLYSHTTTVVVADDLSLAILVTESDTDHTAQFLAQYQSDRLASGLIFGRVFDTFDGARRDLGWADVRAVVSDVDDDDEGCQGHESLDGAHMGETVYCDGSCR